jgi:hypothetical protein
MGFIERLRVNHSGTLMSVACESGFTSVEVDVDVDVDVKMYSPNLLPGVIT